MIIHVCANGYGKKIASRLAPLARLPHLHYSINNQNSQNFLSPPSQ